MNKLKIKKGFTLVELIIVITILVILATIAFVSFQNYTKDARDSNRLMSIKNIQNGLEGFQIKTGFYPEPENSINILAGTSTISKQGYFGESQSDIINIDKLPLDPLDGTKYIYSINARKNKYQLLSYLEANSQLSFVNEVYADDLTERNIKSFGNDLGIILNQDKTNITGTGFDILSNTGNLYSLVFTDNNITLSGSEIFTNIYNKREDLIKDENLASLDDSLVGYWNMETVCKDGNCGVGNDGKLKDFSKYGNNGTCYNSGNIVNCGEGLGPLIVNESGTNSKSMSFNSLNNTKVQAGTGGIDVTKSLTVFLKIKFDNFKNENGLFFINGSSGRYIYSSTYRTNGEKPSDSAHIGTLRSDGSWGFSTSEKKSYFSESIWYTIQYVVNPMEGYIKVYRDGILIQHITTTPYSRFIGNPINMTIGGLNEINLGSRSLNGKIDEIRIYNRALSEKEINFLYNTLN